MKIKYGLIFLLAIVFTTLAVFNAVSTYRIAEQASEDQLKSTAAFIGITLAQALDRTGIDDNLFVDVMKQQPWENVAFIALYDHEGNILLHSSRRLIGKRAEVMTIEEDNGKGSPVSRYLKLKTGETVYGMDIPVHLDEYPGRDFLLRVALHTYPAREGVRSAGIHGVAAFIFIVLLWVLSFSFFYYSRRVDSLQKKNMEKDHLARLGEMSAVLAHEIRSPLSAIKGFAQYIREKKGRGGADDEGLEVIISEARRLESLTEDLLLYSKTRERSIEQFSLEDLIDEVLNIFAPKGGVISIKKNTSFSGTVATDREKLRHVLINIMQNALDSLGNEGSVELRSSGDNGMVVITVTDTGSGMDRDTLNQAFKPFYTTKEKGTGLGLSIVEKLVTSLEGTVHIESQVGKGTSVKITFPGNLE